MNVKRKWQIKGNILKTEKQLREKLRRASLGLDLRKPTAPATIVFRNAKRQAKKDQALRKVKHKKLDKTS